MILWKTSKEIASLVFRGSSQKQFLPAIVRKASDASGSLEKQISVSSIPFKSTPGAHEPDVAAGAIVADHDDDAESECFSFLRYSAAWITYGNYK